MAKMYGLARLGRDAELRRTPGGDAVANLSLAFSYGQKGQDGKRPTQWVDASLWGKRAESLAPYLLKGGLHLFTLEDVHIETYQGRNGEGHKLAARVVDVELAGNGEGRQGAQDQPQQRAAPSPTSSGAVAAGKPAQGFDDMDDDIPF